MSSRNRSGRVSVTPAGAHQPSTAQATQERATHDLGPFRYAPPSAPLNATAISELERLRAQSDTADRIKKLQDKAVEHLTLSTTSIHERARQRNESVVKIRARIRRLDDGQSSQTRPGSAQNEVEGEDADEDENARLKRRNVELLQEEEPYATQLQRKANDSTTEAEAKLRSVIDQQARRETRQRILSEVSGNVIRGEGRVAPTQSTLGASQFRTQPNLGADDEDEAEGDASGQATSVLDVLKRKMEEEDSKYEASTMRQRYAQHNDYIGFKGSVHDAIHNEDGVRLPPYTQWFPNELGDNDDVQMENTDAPNDGDSDIEVARETISTKCPLTLRELDEVLTSPCDHNFEAAMIKEMISRSQDREPMPSQSQRRGAPLGARIIRCPVATCNTRFTEKDLRVDRIMRRKIARRQEQNRLAEEGGDDDFDDSRKRAVSVYDDPSRSSNRARQSTAPRIKPEPQSSMAPKDTMSKSGVSGLDDDDDDDGMEDDEMDED